MKNQPILSEDELLELENMLRAVPLPVMEEDMTQRLQDQFTRELKRGSRVPFCRRYAAPLAAAAVVLLFVAGLSLWRFSGSRLEGAPSGALLAEEREYWSAPEFAGVCEGGRRYKAVRHLSRSFNVGRACRIHVDIPEPCEIIIPDEPI